MTKRDLQRLDGVKARLAIVLYEAQKRSDRDFHVGYMGGRRTSQEQNALYKAKKSKKDGYKKLSKHQSGKAVDFVVYDDNGKYIQTYAIYWEIFQLMNSISKELFGLQLRSGGDWDMDGIPVNEDPDENFADYGHVEI